MASRKQRGDLDGKIAGLYDLEQTIGKGHFAVVKLARHVFTGEKVAVKVIDKTKLDEVSKSHLFQEVRCMKLVQHPHVVRLYEVIDTQTKLYLILELGDGGDMYDYIMTKYEKKGLDDMVARKYFKQIVEAIAYCHKLHVVHRDLKPENVVFFEKLGVVKLTDFGFSNMFNPGKKLETSCGSLAYSAPEILLGDSYDAPKVDIWSLGVILFMLVCGAPPFQEANDSETLTMIMDCKYHIPSHVNKHCKQLITRMLIRDPSKRATLNEIMLNPWIIGGSMSTSPPIQMPLISRELISDDIQNYVIEKMYEGNIANKEEIMQSLERDAYDHIAATYYLLAERKLKRQQQEMQQAAQRLQCKQSQSQQSAGQNGKPHLEPLSLSPRAQPKDLSKEKTCGLIQSLVSPISNHSQPSAVSDRPKSPDGLALRKYSLIKEESFEDEMEDLSDRGKDIMVTKSMDNLEDMSPNKLLTPASSSDNISGRRPLVSVASSPQLLNQISEENESEEEDYVPSKLPSRILARNSVASPEMLRKFEQRKKRRGAGQRGTSCSSSDASDTDDTEGRSRKDKLKHRFIHRRDSSDHSSDTDGPNGHSGNLGGGHHFSSNGGGQGGGGGGSGGKSQKKDKGDKGGGGHKGGHSRHHGMRENHSHNTNSLTAGVSDFSMSSAVSTLSLGSTISKSSQKYILEEDEGEKENLKDSWTYNVNSSSSHRSDSEYSSEKGCFYIGKDDKMSVCSADCSLHHRKQKRSSSKMKTDINSNGLHPNMCKHPGMQHVPIETKCCSVV